MSLNSLQQWLWIQPLPSLFWYCFTVCSASKISDMPWSSRKQPLRILVQQQECPELVLSAFVPISVRWSLSVVGNCNCGLYLVVFCLSFLPSSFCFLELLIEFFLSFTILWKLVNVLHLSSFEQSIFPLVLFDTPLICMSKNCRWFWDTSQLKAPYSFHCFPLLLRRECHFLLLIPRISHLFLSNFALIFVMNYKIVHNY